MKFVQETSKPSLDMVMHVVLGVAFVTATVVFVALPEMQFLVA